MNDYEDEGYNLLPVLIAALAGRGIARSATKPGARLRKARAAELAPARKARNEALKVAGKDPDASKKAWDEYRPKAAAAKKRFDASMATRVDRSGLAGLLAAGGAASLMDNDTSDLLASGLTGVALGGHLGGAFKRLPKDSAVRNFIPYENPFRGPISGGITGGALGLGAGYALQPERGENEYFGY